MSDRTLDKCHVLQEELLDLKLLFFSCANLRLKRPKPKCLLLHIHVLMTSHFLP